MSTPYEEMFTAMLQLRTELEAIVPPGTDLSDDGPLGVALKRVRDTMIAHAVHESRSRWFKVVLDPARRMN